VIYPQQGGNTGVYGIAQTGYGGAFTGGQANLYLGPRSGSGPPTDQIARLRGAIWVDADARIWRCTTSGTPGTWRPLNSVVPITPVRILYTGKDFPHIANGPNLVGPYPSGSYVSAQIAGFHGVPSDAIGVVCTLTAVPYNPNSGFLALFPQTDGKGNLVWPGTSSLNFSGKISATGVTVGMGTGKFAGKVGIAIGATSAKAISCNVALDVTAYIV